MSRRRLPDRASREYLETFFTASAAGDVALLRELLQHEPALVRERGSGGATALHLAVNHPAAVRVLLEHGADANARDVGDNATPLFGAVRGPIESVRLLLDAGSDVRGAGDVHELEAIGAATVFDRADPDIVDLLVERGARHHIFSAIALGDADLVRRVIAEDPAAIRRRLSRFEQQQTALHYVIAPPDGLLGGVFRTGDHYRLLDILIEHGADLDARDAKGRTPLDVAMLRGDHEAMRRLHAAGAHDSTSDSMTEPPAPESLADAVHELTPMIGVSDIDATIAWYREIGFTLHASHEQDGRTDWASIGFGNAQLMFVPSSEPAARVSLWVRTDRIDDLYAIMKRRQLERARALLDGIGTGAPEVRFTLDLHTAFYGQREFCIRDPNGIELYFHQPLERSET